MTRFPCYEVWIKLSHGTTTKEYVVVYARSCFSDGQDVATFYSERRAHQYKAMMNKELQLRQIARRQAKTSND